MSDRNRNALGVHFRNPLFVSTEQSQAALPPQKLKTKVKRAKKEAKKAKKDAQKAKKTAVKAKTKAHKVQADALLARGMIQEARDVTGDAVREADLAEDAHVRAMRWATSVGNSAYGIRDETRDALAEAKQFSKKSDYCTHEVI